jgi:UrcA family protein
MTHRAILIALAMASSAMAQQPTAIVSYADLDLSRAEGVAELDRRLMGAARIVCRPHQAYLEHFESVKRCREQALGAVSARRSAALAAAAARAETQLASR